MSSSRQYSPADRLLIGFQQRFSGFARPGSVAARPSPADEAPDAELDANERRHAAGLMRINHAGEIAAQALYHGQALVSRDPTIRAHLLDAADEERAHLQWCEQRLAELGDRPSLLQPLWYAGSFAIGAAAGVAGDRWSLGFVEETEKQVSEHLDDHLRELPAQDERSRAVLQTMRADEQRHGQEAAQLGAQPLPAPVRGVMRRVAAFMKAAAYRV
ncbi:2-polyprenyl-3-methyl-6-methoxy-1,4-benzoquinone monooxygenase [Hydrocarboniphaga effusa]|jgi:ubiquinone biosynthesis monooxygenase Coq7|uniref:2-polyprenyl-3-methyl-6-methoxy-1,4-benzoquinone monooxygenase n=1 Tax=Hydrocarboniphaga effusa TaxID=243629 RepID=UPI003137AFEA